MCEALQVSMPGSFDSKQAARDWVWDTLQNERVARFPFPPHGRIPNFKGAGEAAERLVKGLDFRKVKRVKVNPDAPQRPVRALFLEKGVTVYVPTPRLKGGFKRLDPESIPEDKYKEAAGLKHMDRYAQPVDVMDLPRMDYIVAGSVAVTRSGKRAGKGEGYSDLEYGILRELGHPEAPVATTVHPLQVVNKFPRDETDLPLSLIATEKDTHVVKKPPAAPKGIDWELLGEQDLDAMPVLRELQSAL